MRDADLFERLAEIVVVAHDSRRLGDRLLELVLAMTRGRSAAVFKPGGKALRLLLSRGIDQDAIEAVQSIWARFRPALEAGEKFYVADRESDRRLAKLDLGGAPSLVLLPVIEEGALVAMLFVDSARSGFCNPNDLDRIGRLSRIVARLVKNGEPEPAATEQAVVRDYLERTPLGDMQREKTMLLLDQNDWNIARVSRLMNVTRRTIYLRLARYGVTPEKARKSLREKKAAG